MCEIINKFPRHSLGYFPTPLVELKRLGSHLAGPRVFMKRDDHSGLAFGGNKIRKLEFLCAQALLNQSDTLITAGAIQSNHCRLTAAAAAKLGLECHLLLGGHEPAKSKVTGNLLLDKLLNAKIHWMGEKRKGEDIEVLAEKLKQEGRRPYIIPYGGSNPIGALGYVNAMIEIMLQLKAMNTSVDTIIFPSGSGGTHAGLIVGAALTKYKGRILGVRVDKSPHLGTPFEQQVEALAHSTAELCGVKLEAKVELEERYLGGGYGVVGDIEKTAIKLLAEKEGIFMDPVYTGRAMGAFIDLAKKGKFGKGHNILLLHTGGQPALFCYPNELL